MAQTEREREPLSQHTVFRIGGPARWYAETGSTAELIAALKNAGERGAPWLVLGAGSNVLVSERGFAGTVIHPAGGDITVRGNRVVADAGVSMAQVVATSLRAGLRGFEWAIGVPGTIGGSVRGNAGCFGREMKDVVRTVRVYDASSGEIAEWPADAAAFAYRESVFKRRPELVVVSAELALAAGDPAEGRALLRQFTRHRAETQDIGSHSAGCIFKNIRWDEISRPAELIASFPEFTPFRGKPAIPAGFLIDRLGLKGRRAGGAKISERHGNFIINTGSASAGDVRELIRIAKDTVGEHYGLRLEEEIQYVGFG